VEDSGDGVGVGDDLEDTHAAATFSAAGDVDGEDAGEELCPGDAPGSGRGVGEDSAGSLERAKSSGSCGGGGAAGLGMTCSRRRWWLASTP
jgi:hypothetical protein